jgi:hypothetical protein
MLAIACRSRRGRLKSTQDEWRHLGLDANLAQYTLGAPHNIDYLNKLGNDIRIFIRFSFDLPSLATKLELPAQ